MNIVNLNYFYKLNKSKNKEPKIKESMNEPQNIMSFHEFLTAIKSTQLFKVKDTNVKFENSNLSMNVLIQMEKIQLEILVDEMYQKNIPFAQAEFDTFNVYDVHTFNNTETQKLVAVIKKFLLACENLLIDNIQGHDVLSELIYHEGVYLPDNIDSVYLIKDIFNANDLM